ncbi:coordinator of PRMT5 and differentiation stimulator [Struthio camelus]|uniref:coordinator of PRMT5 and differentiation stimulator n=1 Tax=Struthio camelus TaxID=8801 RepID=UPI00051E1CD9|nr:PREDICTED: coordinator of PRMT5 and differentiation stimulator isoform X1 [Struthio camelus australis]
MAAAVGFARLEEERLPSEGGAAAWRPRKECLLKNIPNIADNEAQEGEFPDIPHYEKDASGSPVESAHFCPDLEDSDGEASSMPEAAAFPELQTASEYEVEDWDKELEDSEFTPYDAGDLHCGSFQENNLLASYSWREDSFYNPGCHHAACVAFTSPIRMTETGQFDDAEE